MRALEQYSAAFDITNIEEFRPTYELLKRRIADAAVVISKRGGSDQAVDVDVRVIEDDGKLLLVGMWKQ